jgi:DNA-binding response OmpR family regulator
MVGKHVNPNRFVVVLEDDPQIRPLLERWLGEAGFRVGAPESGEARPVLVIADVPDPQSAEVRIASLQAYAAPILVLSARFRRGLAGSADAARRLGVAKVLPKPFTRRELLSAIREALQGTA